MSLKNANTLWDYDVRAEYFKVHLVTTLFSKIKLYIHIHSCPINLT